MPWTKVYLDTAEMEAVLAPDGLLARSTVPLEG